MYELQIQFAFSLSAEKGLGLEKYFSSDRSEISEELMVFFADKGFDDFNDVTISISESVNPDIFSQKAKEVFIYAQFSEESVPKKYLPISETIELEKLFLSYVLDALNSHIHTPNSEEVLDNFEMRYRKPRYFVNVSHHSTICLLFKERALDLRKKLLAEFPLEIYHYKIIPKGETESVVANLNYSEATNLLSNIKAIKSKLSLITEKFKRTTFEELKKLGSEYSEMIRIIYSHELK